ncbi:Uncharacterized protein dnm_039010 [Desulfonema magnum]|uniref:Uncharacterized protein n=1 Tax=Desulfonema magnum TaxID=45655 RepID=A0A975BLW4_9BACT|nr:Uncharacterized protein dnm_039010 [Desulfonema magnum]
MIKFFSVIPAKAGIHSFRKGGIGQKRIPAFAGMTRLPGRTRSKT